MSQSVSKIVSKTICLTGSNLGLKIRFLDKGLIGYQLEFTTNVSSVRVWVFLKVGKI